MENQEKEEMPESKKPSNDAESKKSSNDAESSKQQEAPAEGINSTEQFEQNMSGIEKFVKKRKERKRNSEKAALSRKTDLIAFLIIIFCASVFKASNFKGQHTALLYYEQPAEVIKTEEIELKENAIDVPENLKDMHYRITIMYYVGKGKRYKDLYYKKNPKYESGDVIMLKVSSLDPDKFEIIDK